MKASITALFLGASLLSVTATDRAQADWPIARHDVRRTAAATGVSNLKNPVEYLRAYLGGRLAGPQFSLAASNTGAPLFVFANGGRLHAVTTAGEAAWSTPLLGIGTIVARDDLDGDGIQDFVVTSSDHAYVVNSQTGDIEWSEQDGEMGTLGAVRVADLDGDKRADLFVQECGCCGVNSGKTGFAYSFGSGFAAAKQLWSLPSVECGGYYSLTLVDAQGDGTYELLHATSTKLTLLDGKTGTGLASSPDLGVNSSAPLSSCVGVDLDGTAGEEVLCVNQYGQAPRGHRLFALKYDAAAPAKLSLLWDVDVGAVDGFAYAAPDVAVDLDGDGKKELVAWGKTSAGIGQTLILDGRTGAQLASVDGGRPTGSLRVGGAARLLIQEAGDLSAYSFDRSKSPSLLRVATLPQSATVQILDPKKAPLTPFSQTNATLDVDGDGQPELLTADGQPPKKLSAWKLSSPPSSVGTYPFPADTGMTAAWLLPSSESASIRLVVARSDGRLAVMDDRLALSTGDGVLFGGFVAPGGWRSFETSPVVAKLGTGSVQSILAVDSRSALVRFDASLASNSAPAQPVWRKTSTFAPAIVPGLDGGKPGILCRGYVEPVVDPVVEHLQLLTADGTPLWSARVEGTVFGDVLPTRSGSTTTGLVYQWGSPTGQELTTRMLDVGTGKTIWSSLPITPGAGRQPSGYAVSDWNGDGVEDVVYHGGNTRVVSGADGVEIAKGGPSAAYFLPIVADVDGDMVDEVTLVGGILPVRTLRHDLSTELFVGEDDRPYPYGAIATCGARRVLVQGSWLTRARLKFIELSGATPGTFTSIFLAGGMGFSTEVDARAAKAPLSQITNANVHADLDGSGGPTAVVGSEGGFVYAVDPCNATLRFSVNLGVATGEVVFGDTDGDGNDELIVDGADGFLHVLREPPLPAPQNVIDLDSKLPGTTDVSVTTDLSGLSAKWDAVPAADSYEVTAVGPDGKYFTTPAWTNVGNVTTARIDAPLASGSRYVFGVRAISTSKGVGPDTPSNGVIVATPAADAGPDAGPDATQDASTDAAADVANDSTLADGGDRGRVEGGGCGCRTAPSTALGARSSLLLLLVTVGLLARRNRP